MAIQFARAEFVSRTQGKNACCKAAYNAREKITDSQTGVTYTFERIKDNAHHEILLNDLINKKFNLASNLSNEVEQTEKRKNSQLFKEYVIALPDDQEISLEDKIELARRFIKSKEFVRNNLGVQLDLHKPHDGENNWHAHILVTTRRFSNDGQSLGQKARDLNPTVRGGRSNPYVQKDLTSDGALWTEIQNKYFIEKGYAIRVDSISNTPGIHLGPVRMRGLMNEAAQLDLDLKMASEDPIPETGADVLELVTKRKAVFSEHDLVRAVKDAGGLEKKQDLIEQAKNSSEIMPLMLEDGRDVGKWTTRKVRQQEERATRIADRIYLQDDNFTTRNKAEAMVESLLTDGALSQHQASALSKLVHSGVKKENDEIKQWVSLKILQGRAGTGKSHVLGHLNNILSTKRQVFGLAPTHKAVSELKSRGFVDPYTIKGFLFKHKNGLIPIPDKSAFVVDEAGMVDTETYLELLKVVRGAKASLVLAGDDRQLTSIQRGGLFKTFSQRYGYATLDEIRRQRTEWGADVSRNFACGDIATGLCVLGKNNRIKYDSDKASSISSLLAKWSQSSVPVKERLILTIANKDVAAINMGAREILKQQGIIKGPEFAVESNKIAVFAVGDRIVITKTDKKSAINNGDFGMITDLSVDKFNISFDDGRDLDLNPHHTEFKHGYASTVFKSQGASIKDVYVLHDGFATKNNAYVEMSRHIDDLHFYCNEQATSNVDQLIKQLSLCLDDGASLQYKVAADFAQESNSVFGKIKHIFKLGAMFLGDRFDKNEEYYIFDQKQSVTPNVVREIIGQEQSKIYSAAAGGGSSGTESSIYYANSYPAATDIKILSQADSLSSPSNWNDLLLRTRENVKFAAERIALDLLGEPNKSMSTGKTLRFGEHGKLALDITGAQAGTWYDFSAGKGGDLFALLQREKGVGFKRAVELAQDYNNSAYQAEEISTERDLRSMVKTLDQAEKKSRAKALYKQSLAVFDNSSSLAQRYFNDTRNLTTNKISCDIKFVEKLWNASCRVQQPAIVAFARDSSKTITGVQAIYLNPETANKITTGPAKRSFGVIKGSFVSIKESDSGLTVLAEGIETAMSLADAKLPAKILATLGVHNFKNYQPSSNELVVIAADNDGDNSATTKAITLASNVLQEKGAKVLTISPLHGDFNDLHRQQGILAVSSFFCQPLTTHCGSSWMEKHAGQFKAWHELRASDKKIHQEVQELLACSLPVANTAAEKYLDNTGLLDELAQLPHVRFIQRNRQDNVKENLLGVFMRDDHNVIRGCRITHITIDGRLNSSCAEAQNIVQEKEHGSFMQIQARTEKNNDLFYVENIKTGLALKKAGFTGEIRAVLEHNHFYTQKVASQENIWVIANEALDNNKLSTAAKHLGGNAFMFSGINSEKLYQTFLEHKAKIELKEKLGLTPDEVMQEAAEKVNYLKQEQSKNPLVFKEKNFGVLDFNGVKHSNEASYLAAIGSDKKVNKVIDYDSELGKKIYLATERAICRRDGIPLTNTQQGVMAEMKLQIMYLVDGDVRGASKDNKSYGVEDFQGVKHKSLDTYLLGVAADLSKSKLVDYASYHGKLLKNNHPWVVRQNSQVQAEKETTTNEIMKEIADKHDYLSMAWKQGWAVVKSKEFAVVDFTGKKHSAPSSYLAAVGRDGNIKPFLDLNSELGKKVEREAKTALQREMNLDRGKEM